MKMVAGTETANARLAALVCFGPCHDIGAFRVFCGLRDCTDSRPGRAGLFEVHSTSCALSVRRDSSVFRRIGALTAGANLSD